MADTAGARLPWLERLYRVQSGAVEGAQGQELPRQLTSAVGWVRFQEIPGLVLAHWWVNLGLVLTFS